MDSRKKEAPRKIDDAQTHERGTRPFTPTTHFNNPSTSQKHKIDQRCQFTQTDTQRLTCSNACAYGSRIDFMVRIGDFCTSISSSEFFAYPWEKNVGHFLVERQNL